MMVPDGRHNCQAFRCLYDSAGAAGCIVLNHLKRERHVHIKDPDGKATNIVQSIAIHGDEWDPLYGIRGLDVAYA